jgi:predicted CXXCH cytochrome family protein
VGISKCMKLVLVTAWVVSGLLFLGLGPLSRSARADRTEQKAWAKDSTNPDDYVGSAACQTCHQQEFTNFSKTEHGRLAEAGKWRGEKQGCETCHGPGKAHIDAGGDVTKIKSFASLSPKQLSDTCLQCHAGKEEHNNYRRGEHYRNDVGCTTCHSPHGEIVVADQKPAPSTEKYLSNFDAKPGIVTPLKMLKVKEPQLCLQCHSEIKAQFSLPFHHRVPEGGMKCSDCHNPHGGFEAKQARLSAGADAGCIKCHSDKQGPFVFEHAPLKTEGCTICHTPHGSDNPKLLRRNQVFQLCLECHSNTSIIGVPNTPTFHDIRQPTFQNCTTCHTKIHGSNINEFFFR